MTKWETRKRGQKPTRETRGRVGHSQQDEDNKRGTFLGSIEKPLQFLFWEKVYQFFCQNKILEFATLAADRFVKKRVSSQISLGLDSRQMVPGGGPEGSLQVASPHEMR